MKNKKIIIFAGVVLALVILNHFLGLARSVENALSYLNVLVTQNLMAAMLLYIGLTIVGCVVLALPGITFAIAAGILFGPLLGTVCCSVATTIGAMLAFLAGRFFLKDSIGPIAKKNKYLKKWLFDESGKNELFVLLVTRLVPLFPYNLQNFAYGVTDISFWMYSICSLFFMLPGTAMYTIGTAGLTDSRNRVLYLGMAAVLAVVVLGISAFLKKQYFSEGDE